MTAKRDHVASAALLLDKQLQPALHAAGIEASCAVCMAQASCAAVYMGMSQQSFVAFAAASYGVALREAEERKVTGR